MSLMRTSRALALLALLCSTLTAGALVGSGPASAAPEDFEERWCTDGYAAPCLESATRDGTPVTDSDANWAVYSTGRLNDIGYRYFHFMVQPLGGAAVQPGDEWVITFRTGGIEPRYTEGYAGSPVVTRTQDPDGTWHVTYHAFAVRLAEGCEQGVWPTTCAATATDSQTRAVLSGEVHEKPDLDYRGFDVGQNVDEVNGPFFSTAPDGSQYLEAFMANSHAYDSDPGPGTTATDFVGQVRWRLPYRMLRNVFGIPNPETMVPGSLTGTVTRPGGVASPATFTFQQDPVTPNGWRVDVTNIGFSRKILRVRTGTITPTRPTNVTAERIGAGRGQVAFDASSPRGANVTGYAVRCVSLNGNQVVTASGSVALVTVTGLREGARYDCRVRATSAVGPSLWTAAVRMPGAPA